MPRDWAGREYESEALKQRGMALVQNWRDSLTAKDLFDGKVNFAASLAVNHLGWILASQLVGKRIAKENVTPEFQRLLIHFELGLQQAADALTQAALAQPQKHTGRTN